MKYMKCRELSLYRIIRSAGECKGVCFRNAKSYNCYLLGALRNTAGPQVIQLFF